MKRAEGVDEPGHIGVAEVWLTDVAKSATPAEVVTLFERALGALWRRAALTLGEVTLMAIVDRVLYVATETHPFLSTLTVEEAGISFDAFREHGARQADLRQAVRLVLVDFLTVLGRLTDEILTPALHAELARVSLLSPAPTPGNGDGVRGARS